MTIRNMFGKRNKPKDPCSQCICYPMCRYRSRLNCIHLYKWIDSFEAGDRLGKTQLIGDSKTLREIWKVLPKFMEVIVEPKEFIDHSL